MSRLVHSDTSIAQPAIVKGGDLDQRRAPRFTLLIRAAKLICPEGEFMCVVRDASETGMNLRLFHPLPECETLTLELQNGDQHALEVVWQNEDQAGVRFLDVVDVSRIVECPSRFAKRPIRIQLEARALLAGGLTKSDVKIHNISQQGAKISGSHHFSIDQRVRLSGEGFPEVNAKIRWRSEDVYGLVFEDTFQFGDLARIVAWLQLAPKA